MPDPFPSPPEADVAAAMPSALDFPMGWTVGGHGNAMNAQEGWAIEWRLLALKAPTPTGDSWVMVISAHGPELSRDDWSPTPQREGALRQLEDLQTELREAAAPELPTPPEM